MISLEE
jgi:hypothetical protein